MVGEALARGEGVEEVNCEMCEVERKEGEANDSLVDTWCTSFAYKLQTFPKRRSARQR